MNNEHDHIPGIGDLNEFISIPEKKQVALQDLNTDDVYYKNLKALAEHHPELIDVIEPLVIDEDRFKIFYSESGSLRIVFRNKDEEEINIHSAEDPVDCANRAIDLLGKIEKEGIVVLFGFGLGYFAEEVFDKFEKGHLLLAYEATPELFKIAMKVRDLSGLFESEKVKIMLGEDTDNFSVLHNHHHLIVNGKLWVVEHKPSVRLNSSAYENYFRRLNEEKSLSDIGVATNIRRGKDFMNAFLLNVHSVIKKPGVAGLKDIFKGRTAIVVSAGPSLDKNIHLLKRAKGKAVIIAAGGALPSLMLCDIVPDIIVEIDPVTENIEDKFQGIPELKRVPFVCLSQYTPKLVNIYPGPIYINNTTGNLAFQWLMKFWEDKGAIECFGGSVAHLAFATAEYIGADVIVFVGQDLSYKSNRLHTAGYSDLMDRRLEEGEENQTENILGGIPAKDIFGEDVLTITQFITFKTSFENRIKGLDKVIINATEQGLPIEGAISMRLKDVIDEYIKDENELDTFSVLSDRLDDKLLYDLDGLINEVTMARNTFNGIKKTSKQILKYTRKVKKLKGSENSDSPELNYILRKVETLIEKVQHPGLNLLAGYNYGLELYLSNQKIKEIDEIDDKWEMLDKQLERGDIYYNELIRTISLFNKQLDKVISALMREKEIDSILCDGSTEEKDKYYRAGIKYEEAGLSAQASKYLELSIDKCSGNDHAATDTGSLLIDQQRYIKLADSYIRQFRYYEANEIISSIKKQDFSMNADGPKISEKLMKMSKQCESKIRAWEQRKNQMKKLLADAEENYGSELESGYFYFRISDFERAERAYLKAIASDELSGKNQNISAAFYGLAHTYLEMNDPDKAVVALEKALEVDPSNPVLYRDLGLIAAESDNIEPAEIFLSRAIELAPQEAELYKPLANLYMSLGETEKAVALYESALQANADTPFIQQHLAAIYKETISGTPDCQSN